MIYLMTNKTMKLSHITIENFRAISKLELPLGPQLTVLVGNKSESGFAGL
jgi:predicted ATP-dependent endonuclease of OLD family